MFQDKVPETEPNMGLVNPYYFGDGSGTADSANQAVGFDGGYSPEQIRLMQVARDIFLVGFAGPENPEYASGLSKINFLKKAILAEGVEELSAGFRILRSMLGEINYGGMDIQESGNADAELVRPYLGQTKQKILICSKFSDHHDVRYHFMGASLATSEVTTILTKGVDLWLSHITDEDKLGSLVPDIDLVTYFVRNIWMFSLSNHLNVKELGWILHTICEKSGLEISKDEANLIAERQQQAIADWRVAAEQMAFAA